MDEEKRTALYVRIPEAQAEKLDRAAFELKVPKQDLIAGLVEDMKIAPRLTRRIAAVEVDDGLSVGRASLRPTDPAEVLTLADAAALLQVDASVVESMAESGELPGRKLGGDWRFARAALIGWLGRAEA